MTEIDAVFGKDAFFDTFTPRAIFYPSIAKVRRTLSDSVTTPPRQCDEDWGEIERFLAEVSELSQSCQSLAEFGTETLTRTADLLGALGGAVWVVDADLGMRPLCRVGDEQTMPSGEFLDNENHRQVLHGIAHHGPTTSERLPGDIVLSAAPFRSESDIVGVMELVHRGSTSDVALAGSERLLAMVADLTGDFLRRRQLNELRESLQDWRHFESLSQRAHASLNLRDTAYVLVNDGRLFIGCDRASLVVPRRRRLQALAISGVDTLDRRSPLVASMEALAGAVAPSRQWLRYRGQTDPLPPQLAEPLCKFVDESHAQTIDVVPLLANGTDEERDDLVGVLLLEQFDAAVEDDADEQIIRFANLSSSALRNAIDYETLPLLSLARWMRRALRLGQRKGRRWGMIGTGVLTVILALGLIPATHFVEAEGEAQPLKRRNVYAPIDGEVVEVRVQHDESVAENQVLIVLRSRELDLELERLQGEYQTTEKKLLAVTSARIQAGNSVTTDPIPGQLAAEEQELQQQLDSQRTQIRLVRQQRELLEVRSPIDGQVLTWDPRDLLADRPVQRGQLLITTADLGGPWALELLVDDRSVGQVIAAQRDHEAPLIVWFTLATGSAPSYRGTLMQISGRTEVIGDDPAAARVLVSVPNEAIELLRPGTTMKAKFDCGRRPLGYVLLHDVYDRIRSWLLF